MFFNSDYRDLMPDHPEPDQDPSFVGLLGRSCGKLLKTNLLFLLGSVPVVTLPLSLYAANRVIRRIMRDQPAECFRIFKETFRKNWKQSYQAFLLTAPPLGLAVCGMWFYMSRAGANFLFLLPFLVCSTAFLVTLLSSGCLYGLLDAGKDLGESLRLALLLGVGKPLRTAPAALFFFGLPLLAVLALPLSGLYWVLLGFSLPCFVGNYFLSPLMEPYIQYDGDDGGGDPAEAE